jgi:hypothetical protein
MRRAKVGEARITIGVPVEIEEALGKAAAERDMPVAAFVRMLLNGWYRRRPVAEPAQQPERAGAAA